VSGSVADPAKSDLSKQGPHVLGRLAAQACIGSGLEGDVFGQMVRVAGLQVVIGPGSELSSQVAELALELLLKLMGVLRCQGLLAKAVDQVENLVQGLPSDFIEVGLGGRAGEPVGIVFARGGEQGCQQQAQLSRVAHGSVLFLRVLCLPATGEKTLPLSSPGGSRALILLFALQTPFSGAPQRSHPWRREVLDRGLVVWSVVGWR
jgi:hypothetical protein